MILTVGHSNRSLDDFTRLLKSNDVTLLIDVRAVPRSRHNPQFDRDVLPASLGACGIGYLHAPALGGLRHPRPDSPNRGWRHPAFRGFADHMQSPQFAAALADLIAHARTVRLAVMCAEALPSRCHRTLIADALLAHGVPVAHIVGEERTEPHRLTPFARTEADRVTYPAQDLFEAAPRG